MKAVITNGFGGVEVLEIQDIPIPKPTENQILVRVHAAALNRADLLQRRGKYPPPPGETEILGLEIAGEVAELGKNSNGFTVGQKIFGLVPGGGYAQYCCIDKDMAMPIPENLDFIQAASIPEAFLTANETLFELGQLQPSEAALIHAGASGVGIAGLQMAHYLGVTTYFTAGSDEKIAKVMKLCNAKAGINYKTQDFADIITQLTSGQGVDVIEDFVGANYLMRNLQILKPHGRLIVIAYMSGAKAEIDLSLIQRKRLQIKGFVMRSRSLPEKRAFTRHFSERWLPVITAGHIKPVIDSVFALEDVRQAQLRMEDNLNVGKIVLTIK